MEYHFSVLRTHRYADRRRANRRWLCFFLVVFSLLISACSDEQPSESDFTTAKPVQLRSVGNTELSVVVRIDGQAVDYAGEQLPNGTWQVRLNLDLDTSHTFIASWYGLSGNTRILLMEQSGSFHANATTRTAQSITTDLSGGEQRFDADCDNKTNLSEMESGTNPLSSPGCGGGSEPSSVLPDLAQITGDCNFQIGSSVDDPFHKDDQKQHTVCIEDFSIGVFEVTFDQYTAFSDVPGTPETTPHDRSWGMGSRPVINVSWSNAVAYTKWLSDTTGDTYRLPTEAEWEYAARGGTQTPFWTGDVIQDDQEHFNSNDPYGGGVQTDGPPPGLTRPVGALQPNPFGLYDMLGNVLEMTCSVYDANYQNNVVNQCSDDLSRERVHRGGSYGRIASWSRVYHRTGTINTVQISGELGFRVVRENP